MDLKYLCEQTAALVRQTGEFIRSERIQFKSLGTQSKGKHDYVTYVDKGAEERLVSGLHNLLPESGFIAEEGTSNKKGEKYNWVIDPIDGTTNFIHACPPYAVSVALLEDSRIILGVVYEIVLDECFYSYEGGKAYLNGKLIHVSETESVSESLIATGFPYNNFGRMESFMKTLEYFFVNTHGVRRLGSAATDLAYVACGRYDAFYEYNLKPWDVAAGAFIVEQAGGKVSDFRGGRDFLFGNEIVATNNRTFKEFKEKVAYFMNSNE
jgi:myo-inositol-1(or 4)-monophosphatase